MRVRRRQGRPGDPAGGEPGSHSAPGNGAPGGYGTLASLHLRDYRLLWFGVFFHSTALWIEQVARPFLIYEMTGSAAALGALVAVRASVQLVLGVFSGAVTDWFDRKRVLVAAQAASLTLNVVFAAILISGSIEVWHLYVATGIRGGLNAFDQPARQSLIPSLVPTDRVLNAVALLSATQNMMRVFGAALSGFLIWAIGVEGAWVAIVVIYSGAVVSNARIRVARQERLPGAGARFMFRTIREGWSYSFRHPAIRGALIVALAHFAFGLAFLQVFAPLFALDVLDIGPFGQGMLLSAAGAGAAAGTFFIASRAPRRVGLVLPLQMIVYGAMLVAFALSTYVPVEFGNLWLWVPFVFVFFVGIFQSGIIALVQALALHKAPSEMRGRVMGVFALDRATMMFGAAAGGFLAEAIGTQAAQMIYGALLIVSAVLLLALAPGFRSSVVDPSEATPHIPVRPRTPLDAGAEAAQEREGTLARPGREGRDAHLLG